MTGGRGDGLRGLHYGNPDNCKGIDMKRIAATLLVLALAQPLAAATEAQKEADCQAQADLMGQVQAARLDRVRKGQVVDRLMAANPDWPAAVATALPAVVEYVYSLRRRDLRDADLAATTKATCLQNYEQIQALRNSATN